MEGDDSHSRSVQGLLVGSGNKAGLGLRESQYLLKPRANKMDGEEKKPGSKRRSKPIAVRFDSDDDEPIGSIFKLVKPRNPKMIKSGLDGGGDTGKKVEARAENLVVEDEDLGGMDDTLASFRKKLKGPKKDSGSAASVGGSSSLSMVEQSDRLLKGPLVDGGLAAMSMPMVVEKGQVIGDNGSQVIVDEGLEIKPKRKLKKSKRASMPKESGVHSEFDDGSDYQKLLGSSLQKKEDEILRHGEGSNHSSDENLEDSLFAFVQKAQSGSSKKSKNSFGLKQKKGAQTTEDGLSPYSDDVPEDFPPMAAKRPRSGCGSKLSRKNLNSKDSLRPLSSRSRTASATDQSRKLKNQRSNDGLREVSSCKQENPLSDDTTQGLPSVPASTAEIIRVSDKRNDISSESILEESFSISAQRRSHSGLVACSNKTIKLEDGELNGQTEGIQEIPTGDPCGSVQFSDGDAGKVLGARVKDNCSAFNQQCMGVSTIHPSSADQNLCSSPYGNEIPVPCFDDLLNKPCQNTCQEPHKQLSGKYLEMPLKPSIENSSPHCMKMENGSKSEVGIDTVQCTKAPQFTQFDSPKVEETCSDCDGLNQIPGTYTDEPKLAPVSLQKEAAVVSGGRLSPITLTSSGAYKSELASQMNHEVKSQEPGNISEHFSQGLYLNESFTTIQKYSSTLHQSQPSDEVSRGTSVPSHDNLSVDDEANGASSPSIAPDQNESYPEDAVSMPDCESRDNKLSVGQRAPRKTKKRRHGDMAYEGDADWDILIHEQSFLESHPVVDGDRSFRTRGSSNMRTETENGGAAAISAGLKAREAGPVEKIKFKDVLKRKGGLQEYLECRNQILGLWSKDVSRILPLADCGVTDSPSEDESPRASLIRDVYAFLDQSGYINVGIASEKEKADPSAKHNYKLVKEKNFVEISGALVADSEDGVSFILGQVKGSETPMEVKNGVAFDDKNQTSEATKGERLDTQRTLELSTLTEREECSADVYRENGCIDANPTDRMVNFDVLRADPSSEILNGVKVPVVTPEPMNDSYGVQSTLIDYVDGNHHVLCESEGRKRIIVIGAGPAGLTAARHLQRQGFSVTVLEARNRLGGRVYTDHSSLSVPVDLGASIITGVEADVATERRPDPSSLVCAQLGLELTVLNSDCPLYDFVTGQKVPADMDEALEAEYNGLLDDMVLLVAQKGEHAMRMSLEDGLEYALKRRRMARSGMDLEVIELHKSVDVSFDSEKVSVDSEIPERNSSEDEILSPLERRVMDWHFANLEYGCAALLKEVSLPYWNQDDVYGGFGGAHCMIKGGYSTVVESLGEGLRIHLNHVVTNVSYSTKDFGVADDQCNKVKVSTSNGSEFLGDAVLITVPLGCLKAETIKFTPPLPQWKHSSIQRLGFGVLNKVVLEFPDVFWDDSVDYFGATAEETNQRGQCFMFWNVRKTVGAPVLIALVVGKAAIDGQNVSSSDHINHALMVLRKLFGEASVPNPVASVVTDWGRDPFSYGAYSYVAVGASGEDYDIIGRPVENCLFFAGEATCKEHPDTVGGAMMSGLREAVRIIGILSTGNDYTAEVEAMEAAQRHSDSERDEVRDITKRLDAVELSNVLYKNSLDGTHILTREALLQDIFFNAKTTAGRLHLAKELLTLPVQALKSFAGTKDGLTTLNSWILDSMGKDGTQLLRHCVRLLVLVSTDLLAVRSSGIGKTVKEKVCVHTSRDIRAIASQLVSVWIEIFRKEKASNGGLKLLRQTTATDSSKSKSIRGLASGKPPLRTHHGTLDNKGSMQVPASAGSHLPSNTNIKKVNGKSVKLETMTDSRSDINSSRSEGSIGRLDAKGDEDNFTMSEEEQAAFAAAEAARAAALAAVEAYASSEAKCNTLLQLPKIPSFHKFARREQYAQVDESDLRRNWSGGVLGRQDCISEIDSRNYRVRNWSVDFSAACVNLDSSRMSADNLSQRSHSNEIACQMNFREHSGESAAVDSSLFTKAWVDTAGSVGVKDYHAIERWQSQAAAADPGFFHPTMHIKDEEDSNTVSNLPTWKHDRLANESSVSQVTINKQLLENQPGADRIKQAVVDYVASLLMPLYKARKIDKEGYKSIMKKTATKVMEQATDAEKAMSVSEFLDYKRKNKIRSFVDKLIEKHMAMKPAGKS